MKKNIFAAVLSIASLSAGSVFSAGVDSAGSGTQDYSFILDSGNSISINRITNTPKLSGKFPDGSEIKNGYNSASWTQIEAKWDYNGTTLGLSTGTPYAPHTILYEDGALTNAGAKLSSNETAILASRGIGNGMKVFGGIRLNQFKVRTDRPFATLPANSTYSIAGGYTYELDSGTTTGFAIGAAYEMPQIMLRASIQYNSEIAHKQAKETETIAGTVIAANPDDLVAPSSMIIKLRSAITPRMLAYANWRSSKYSALKVTGNNAGGAGVEGSIYSPTSGTDYVVGLAYKVNDQINLALATAKGQSTDDGSLANALSPRDGSSANIIGGSFKVNENVEINASYALVSYGDANAFVVTGAGPFEDNKGTRVSIGTKINF
jgi:long-chain fatty acid transport protein